MRYKIPKSWSDINIGQFQEIQRLDKSDELDYLISMVSVVCHLDVDTVESLTLTHLRDIGSKMAFLNTMPDKFVNYFKLKDTTYFVDCNIANISAGQYIDLNKYIEEGAEENLHKILTVFCLPTKRKWFKRKQLKYGEGYDISKMSNEMLQAPVSVAYPLALFFCKLLEKSMPVIQDCLVKEMESLNKVISSQLKKEKVLKSTGGGSL